MRTKVQKSENDLTDAIEQTQPDGRWAAVVGRTRDHSFVYAVRSTSIYCRSHCSSRLPLFKNVEFFDSAVAAEVAGYRPCKRCLPNQVSHVDPAARAVVCMCKMLEEQEKEPKLVELAAAARLSGSHAHRVFSRLIGLSPKVYRDAIVRKRVTEQLEAKASVTQTIYAAGFSAPSRFYERVSQLLGMSAQQYRAGASGMKIHFAVGQCSLGAVLVAASERGVCAVHLGDDPHALVLNLQDRFSAAELIGADSTFESTVAKVVTMLETQSAADAMNLPLDIQGTAFQQRVYQALSGVPRGETITYRELAVRMGMETGARAVANACAKNELAVLIPCHRVVRTDGSLSGYRWGVERKRILLQREKI